MFTHLCWVAFKAILAACSPRAVGRITFQVYTIIHPPARWLSGAISSLTQARLMYPPSKTD